MCQAGLGIKTQILDNKAQSFQDHRRNHAESATQTSKAHVISILAGVDDKFTLSLWCHLLEPTEIDIEPTGPIQGGPQDLIICPFVHSL